MTDRPLGTASERYKRKLEAYWQRQNRKVQNLSNRTMKLMDCNRQTLALRVIKLEEQYHTHRSKIGAQAARINRLKETVTAQEREIKYLRQQIAVLRKVA